MSAEISFERGRHNAAGAQLGFALMVLMVVRFVAALLLAPIDAVLGALLLGLAGLLWMGASLNKTSTFPTEPIMALIGIAFVLIGRAARRRQP